MKSVRAGLLVIALLALFAVAASLIMDGSKRAMVAAFVAAALPVCVYLAIRKPLIFPFCLYVALIPFDNIMEIQSFGTVTKLLAICSGAAFILAIARSKKMQTPPLAAGLWVSFFLWASVTTLWAISPVDSLIRLATYVQLIILYVVVSAMPATEFDLKVLVWATILGSLAAAVYGYYLFHSGQGVLLSRSGYDVIEREFVKSGDQTIDPNHFGNALLLPISIVAMLTLRQRFGLQKIVFFLVMLVLMLGVYVSGSRGAICSVGVVIGYLFLRTRFKLQIALACGALVGLSFLMPTSPWVRFTTAVSTGGAGRVDIWKVGVQALKHYWFAGAGPANFQYAYDRSFIQVHQNYFAHWHRVSHNLIVGTSVELGVIGLILALAAWYAQWKMLTVVPKNSSLRDLATALEASVVGLLAAAMFVDMLPYKYMWLAFSLGAIVRTVAIKQSNGEVAARFESAAPLYNRRPITQGVGALN